MIGSLALAHLWIALPAIVLSVLLSVPIARWAAFSRRGGWVLSALSALYAVPSLPLLIVIPVIVGVALRSPANMVIVLTLYGVAVLVRQAAEGFRAIGERPGHAHALTLAARQLGGVAIGHLAIQAHQLEELERALAGGMLRGALQARDGRDIVGNASVGEESALL